MNKIKELRVLNNVSQSEIAKILNTSQKSVSNYENGKTEPTIEILKKLASFYDVSIDFLVGRPRPYDLPSSATPEQKSVIQTILQLNPVNTLKAQAYCLGLLANQD